MELEILILSKDRKKNLLYDTPYMWNLKQKNRYKWTYLQNRVTDFEKKLVITKRGNVVRKDKLGVGD